MGFREPLHKGCGTTRVKVPIYVVLLFIFTGMKSTGFAVASKI
jgi:hypothetical protein